MTAQPSTTAQFVVTTIAGGNGSTIPGYANGVGTYAMFYSPLGISFNSSNNQIFVSDAGNIRTINAANVVTTLVGCGNSIGLCGSSNGIGTYVQFGDVTDACFDPFNNNIMYVADYGDNVLRQINYAGVSTTFAGTALVQGTANGLGTYAQFGNPNSMAYNPVTGTFFVPDDYYNVVREVTFSGLVTTFAGRVLVNIGGA